MLAVLTDTEPWHCQFKALTTLSVTLGWQVLIFRFALPRSREPRKGRVKNCAMLRFSFSANAAKPVREGTTD